jgi:hypothetical protein
VRTLSQQPQPNFKGMSDEQLVDRITEWSPRAGGEGRLAAVQAELTRRLASRIVELNNTTASLANTTEALRKEMQTSGRWMLLLTGVLVVLTIVLVVLTAVLLE